jgi:purine nucleosidase
VEKAVPAILEAVGRYGEDLTMAASGPLTNIAAAIQADPQAMSAVREILVMGGAVFCAGNVTPYAEFNSWCDPEALRIVVESGLPVRLFPLDVTHQVRLLVSDIKRHQAACPHLAALIQEITAVSARFHYQRYGVDGLFVHDTLPIAWMIAPELFRFQTVRLAVDTSDLPTRGRTRPDDEDTQLPLVNVAVDIDADGFFQVFWRNLVNAEQEGPRP